MVRYAKSKIKEHKYGSTRCSNIFFDWLEKLILKVNIGTRKTSILLDGTHFEQWWNAGPENIEKVIRCSLLSEIMWVHHLNVWLYYQRRYAIFVFKLMLSFWLYVLVMSCMHFRADPHSVVAWMPKNILLEAGVKYEV